MDGIRKNSERIGVWWHLSDPSPAAIRSEIERLQQAGYNEILIETIYEGGTICPAGKAGEYEQWPEYQGSDPLQIIVDEGRARGIRVHAWVHLTFAGFEDSPLIRTRPEWLARRRDGELVSSLETWDGKGYYFLSPGRPEVQDFLVKNILTLCANYNFDALHLDYIRYPLSIPEEKCEYDYSDFTRQQFKAVHDIDPTLITKQDEPNWQKWCAFREGHIDALTGRLCGELRQAYPKLEISAAVFGDIEDARGKKFQNWVLWAERGWIDSLYFMLYFTEPDVFRAKLRVARNHLPEGFLYTAGLPAFLGLDIERMKELREIARSDGAPGVTWFALNTIEPHHIANLAG